LGEEYRLWSSSLCNFSMIHLFFTFRFKYSQHSVHKTLNLCSSLKVRGQVLHPYSTIGKTTVFFSFLDIRWEDKRFWTGW
jgi:hypothetical protein